MSTDRFVYVVMEQPLHGKTRPKPWAVSESQSSAAEALKRHALFQQRKVDDWGGETHELCVAWFERVPVE